MRIADHCGKLHADYVRAELSYDQLADWIAYEDLTGPLGHDRNDIFWSTFLSFYLNAHSDPKRGTRATADDFDFYHVHEITDDDIEAKLNLAFGKAT